MAAEHGKRTARDIEAATRRKSLGCAVDADRPSRESEQSSRRKSQEVEASTPSPTTARRRTQFGRQFLMLDPDAKTTQMLEALKKDARNIPPSKYKGDPVAHGSVLKLQSSVRQMLVKKRQARVDLFKAVARRRKSAQYALSVEDYSMGNEVLEDIHKHALEATHQAVSNIPAIRRNQAMRSMVTLLHKLTYCIEELGRLGSASSVEDTCYESAILMCDLLDSMHCEVYPVEASPPSE